MHQSGADQGRSAAGSATAIDWEEHYARFSTFSGGSPERPGKTSVEEREPMSGFATAHRQEAGALAALRELLLLPPRSSAGWYRPAPRRVAEICQCDSRCDHRAGEAAELRPAACMLRAFRPTDAGAVPSSAGDLRRDAGTSGSACIRRSVAAARGTLDGACRRPSARPPVSGSRTPSTSPMLSIAPVKMGCSRRLLRLVRFSSTRC